MTFSIVARCAETGQLGIAISSSSIAVGARCPWLRPGVGAVSTQNITLPALGPDVLDLLEQGLAPGAAIDTALQLSDDGLLHNATLAALLDDLKKTLGSTFIGADDYLLQPGQFKFIDLKALDPDTRFIAVFANYYDADNAQWKQTVRVQPTGRHYALLVHLDSAQIELKRETR